MIVPLQAWWLEQGPLRDGRSGKGLTGQDLHIFIFLLVRCWFCLLPLSIFGLCSSEKQLANLSQRVGRGSYVASCQGGNLTAQCHFETA